MDYEERLRKLPIGVRISFFKLDDGWKLEVMAATMSGYGPTMYEGAFASVDAAGQTAVTKLMRFIADLKAEEVEKTRMGLASR